MEQQDLFDKPLTDLNKYYIIQTLIGLGAWKEGERCPHILKAIEIYFNQLIEVVEKDNGTRNRTGL